MARPRGRPSRQRVLLVAKLPFLDELTASCEACERAQDLAAAQRNRQVEDSFFRAAVALETFLSEWLVRCLSFDASHLHTGAEKEFADWLKSQVNSLGGPKGRRYQAYLKRHSSSLSIPKRPSLSEALTLFGSGGDVVGVTGSRDLEKKARDNLISICAIRAAQLTARQRAFLDSTKKVRNALAHSSTGAVSTMNAALRNGNLPADVRRGTNGITRSGIGTYLSGKPNSQRRYAIFFDELAQISHGLCRSPGRPRTISSTT
jgi:hypothetical protein